MANLTGFENLIQKVEQNLKTAETNAQNLSRKFTKTSSQLKGTDSPESCIQEGLILSIHIDQGLRRRKMPLVYMFGKLNLRLQHLLLSKPKPSVF